MNETQDTIDGLLAELREHAAGVLTSGYVTMSGRDFHKMLDRFDAAYKREKAAIEADALAVGGIVGASHEREKATAEKSSAVGDCAKLREALKRIVATSIVAKNANAPEWILQRMADIFAMATTALAAPPRNCDRFGGDIDKLREACARERGLNPEEDFPDVFPGWLLALAQKGGAE